MKDRLIQLQPYLHLALRLFMGGLFLWSGLAKLDQLDAFYATAQAYNVLPSTWMYLYEGILPWLEILAGVYLILGLFLRFSAGLVIAMLLSFIIAIGLVLLRGGEIDCGCFLGGGPSEPVTWELLLRDVGLLAIGFYLLRYKTTFLSLDNYLNRTT